MVVPPSCTEARGVGESEETSEVILFSAIFHSSCFLPCSSAAIKTLNASLEKAEVQYPKCV